MYKIFFVFETVAERFLGVLGKFNRSRFDGLCSQKR